VQPAEYLDVLRDRATVLLVSARADLDAPVPSCPGWTVAKLVAHIAGVWGWAAAVVRTGARLISRRCRKTSGARNSSNGLSNRLASYSTRLSLFWFRRQALETAVHAWDAQHAAAHPEPIDPELAIDGVEEFLSVMLPRHLKQHPGGWTGQSLHLHSTAGKGEWVVHLGPDSAVSVEHAHGRGDAALQGTASSLYLWCLNRAPLTELEVFGDRALPDRWTTEIAF